MQISAANLLASQSQTSVRPRTAADFEPIAFKQAPPASAVSQGAANKPAAATGAIGTPATGLAPAGGYVRPGTNLDIKI